MSCHQPHLTWTHSCERWPSQPQTPVDRPEGSSLPSPKGVRSQPDGPARGLQVSPKPPLCDIAARRRKMAADIAPRRSGSTQRVIPASPKGFVRNRMDPQGAFRFRRSPPSATLQREGAKWRPASPRDAVDRPKGSSLPPPKGFVRNRMDPQGAFRFRRSPPSATLQREGAKWRRGGDSNPRPRSPRATA
jgi:hypothetical protein